MLYGPDIVASSPSLAQVFIACSSDKKLGRAWNDSSVIFRFRVVFLGFWFWKCIHTWMNYLRAISRIDKHPEVITTLYDYGTVTNTSMQDASNFWTNPTAALGGPCIQSSCQCFKSITDLQLV